jgi:hypothetical protein
MTSSDHQYSLKKLEILKEQESVIKKLISNLETQKQRLQVEEQDLIKAIK